MSVYNSEAYLKEAIESILEQTFGNFEFIIINDNSTDKSLDIINSYTDKRIKLVTNEQNMGLTKSLNKGMGIASGKYIARMDADDISMPDRLQKQFDHMEKNSDVVVVGSMYKLIGDKNLTSVISLTNDAIRLQLLTQNAIAHPVAFIRESIFDKYNLRYNESFTVAQDYELWSRIMEYGKLENLPEVLLEYRRHNEQISSVQIEKQKEAVDAVRSAQLRKLIDFTDKRYTESFTLKIIQQEAFGVTSDDMVLISLLIEDLWNANESKKIYSRELFMEFLHNIWAYYLTKLSGYRFNNYTQIMSDPNGIKKNKSWFALKYMTGSVWGLRRRS